MKRIAVFLVLLSIVTVVAYGQSDECLKKDTPTETFEVKGIVSDSSGPLKKITVIAFPFLLPGSEPVTRFWLQDVVVVKDIGRGQNEWVYKAKNEGMLTMSNPKALTDEVGAFSLVVPKGLFMIPCGCKVCKGYKAGELAIGAFTESGAGRWRSTLELVNVKVDVASSKNDVGELSFKPAGPD